MKKWMATLLILLNIAVLYKGDFIEVEGNGNSLVPPIVVQTMSHGEGG